MNLHSRCPVSRRVVLLANVRRTNHDAPGSAISTAKGGRMIADDLNLPALAAGIIMLAISDARWQPKRAATSRDGAREQGRRWQDRATARAFLNSDALDCWCAVANLNADRVRAAIRGGLLDRPAKRMNRYPQRRQRAEICAA